MLCDALEGGWGRGRRAAQEGGDVSICMVESLCYAAETNTTLQSNSTPIKDEKEKENLMHKTQTWTITVIHNQLHLKLSYHSWTKDYVEKLYRSNSVVRQFSGVNLRLTRHVINTQSDVLVLGFQSHIPGKDDEMMT